MAITCRTVDKCFDHYKELVLQQEMLKAIDLYYHDDIIQYENTQEPLVSKALLRTKEQVVLDNMLSLSVDIYDVMIDIEAGVVTGVMHFSFESKELGKRLLIERFKQRWQDGKIREQWFRYDEFIEL